MKAPDFLFENVGSRGNIVPLLSIAGELVRRGYRCHLLANENYRSEVEAEGVGFSSIRKQRTDVQKPVSSCAHIFETFELVGDYLQQPGAYDADTVIVNTDVWAGSEPFAEALCLRTVRLTLYPIRIRSLLAPAWPLGARACGPNGETFLKLTLPAMHRAADRHPELLARINGIRTSVGLDVVPSASYPQPHVVAQAALFPDWYGMPAKDWPQMECLGFPLPSCTDPMPPRLRDFLARVGRPLVFTPGTGVTHAEAFFEAAASCCAALRMPGIFLSPYLRPEHLDLGENVEHFDHIELELVLRHAALLVHHGGMGTTARALQAGIPQIISPVRFDQPDNGHRVELLHAGSVVPRDQLSGSTLAAAVQNLLGDAAMASKLVDYRAAIASTRAVERAADLLESVARNIASVHRTEPLPRRHHGHHPV